MGPRAGQNAEEYRKLSSPCTESKADLPVDNSSLYRVSYTDFFFFIYVFSAVERPPLLSSGQSSWLQIRRPGFDFQHYQKKIVVCLERGPLSLVSTTEELLDRNVAAPV
jgi:hypothetical protein